MLTRVLPSLAQRTLLPRAAAIPAARVGAVRALHVSPASRVLADDSSPQRRHRAESGVAPGQDPHEGAQAQDQATADQAQEILYKTQDPKAPKPFMEQDGLEPGIFSDLGQPPSDFGAGSQPVEPAIVSLPWETYEVEPSLFDHSALRAPNVHPLINKMVGMMTKRGDRAKAEKVVSGVMERLAKATNDSPLPLFVEAIRIASPNVDTVKSKRGAKIIHTPRPLGESASAHRGIKAILEAAFRRKDKKYEDRLAKEFLSIVEGRSGVLQKRLELHKHALANRANLSVRV